MSLLRTSSTLRRLFLEPDPLYKTCAPATRRVDDPSRRQTTTTRPPWAHQTRFSSTDPKGSGPDDDDPYKILGVSKDIPQSEIKKAYYAQAKKLHPDASKRKNAPKFHKLQDAYDKVSTPEARKKHDDKVRERELQKAAQQARDASATPQPAHPREKPRKSGTFSAGEARFVKRESLEWMKKFRKMKEEADAQKERDLAAQRQREITQKMNKQREREAALRDRDRQKASVQAKAANGGTASHEKSEPRSDPKSEPRSEQPRNESGPKDRAGRAEGEEDKRGAVTARKPTVNANPESIRAAILRLSPGTTIPHVVDRLASFAIGSVAEIQIKESGTAKLDFFTADAARKLQHLIRGGEFTVNGKKVQDVALQISVVPVSKDPLASRILMLTHRYSEMPNIDSQDVKFILHQNSHTCKWVEVNHVSRLRTEVHLSSWREAEKASHILQSQFPGIHVRYGIDPATGEKETRSSLLNAILTGEDLPDTKVFWLMRQFVIFGSIFVSAIACSRILKSCLGVGGTGASETSES